MAAGVSPHPSEVAQDAVDAHIKKIVEGLESGWFDDVMIAVLGWVACSADRHPAILGLSEEWVDEFFRKHIEPAFNAAWEATS